jgi:uncharacterized tellurite resistance protein B-like protein|tara:strand:+ start:716 stop:1141 length:426 start_codon:yes stop_codon:yes gene_type:complete
MINFFKNKIKSNSSDDKSYSEIASLLIHAAKIDENYTKEEEEIIKKTLIKLGAERSKIENILSDAKIVENDSIQILNFTKKIKDMEETDKIQIIEALWTIIYSNKNADMYETNLMRRLAGLLYIDAKIMGSIKEKIKKEFS